MMIFIIQSRAIDLSLCSIIMFYCSLAQHCYTTSLADQTYKCCDVSCLSCANTAVKYHNSDSLQLPAIPHLSKLVCEFHKTILLIFKI